MTHSKSEHHSCTYKNRSWNIAPRAKKKRSAALIVACLIWPAIADAAWTQTIRRSPMDGKISLQLLTWSTKPVIGMTGRQFPVGLSFYCEDQKVQMAIGTEAMFASVNGNVAMRIKIDDGPPEQVVNSEGGNFKAAYFQRPREILNKLFQSKSLLIEFSGFRSGIQYASFNTSGLKPYEKIIIEHCGKMDDGPF